jgi:hypothetical protein
MSALVKRELTCIARTPAFSIALGVHLSLLGGFLVLWSEGMPVLPGATVYDQLLLVQSALLSAILPWVVARCGTGERGDDIVVLGATTASAPFHVLLAQCIGRFLALTIFVSTALPFALLAAEMSGGSRLHVLSDLLASFVLCAAASVVTSWCILACRGRLSGWLFATGVTIGLWWASHLTPVVPDAWLFITIAAVCIGDLAMRADSRFRYLSEDVA